MPSPFKRRSGQIQPMSHAELDASLAELEAREAEDKEQEGVYITRHPGARAGEDSWLIFMTEKSGHGQYPRPEGSEYVGKSRADAEVIARRAAQKINVPFLGER